MKHRFVPGNSILWKANVLVFISSFCVMVIELIAARILAPHIGVSLYTWTSIIGTILASIALGNYLGGRVADRYASPLVLAAVFLAGSLATIGILPATKVVTSVNWFGGLPPMLNFTLKTGFIFFLPAFFLSMVSPLTIKLTLSDLRQTGGVVGTIYAVSTAGSILGTYMTGFYFILWFGLRTIVWVVAGVLILTGILTWFSWKIPGRWRLSLRNLTAWVTAIVVVLTSALLFQFRDRWQETYTKESNYYSIQVHALGGMKALYLDHVIHAYVIPDNPKALEFPYLKVFDEIVQYANKDRRPLKVLHLGGGGYSFPRYLEAVYPGSINEVVEIDPAVTEVAHQELGLPRNTTIKTYNLDARQFLIQRIAGTGYNIIVGDVFSDYSTPHHLTTLEFGRMVKANIEKDGIYLVNIVDSYALGTYMASVIHTLKQVFANVYLFTTEPTWGYATPINYVLAATDCHIDLTDFRDFTTQEKGERREANPQGGRELDEYLANRRVLLLTDDCAPTDILLARIRR